MLGGNSYGRPMQKWTPFRDNLMRVLDRADSISDEELKTQLQVVIDTEVEENCDSKSRVKRIIMMRKAVH